jgi:hypothetical protein
MFSDRSLINGNLGDRGFALVATEQTNMIEVMP